jgi:diguanylate cyclase (GGDEF)-like protein
MNASGLAFRHLRQVFARGTLVFPFLFAIAASVLCLAVIATGLWFIQKPNAEALGSARFSLSSDIDNRIVAGDLITENSEPENLVDRFSSSRLEHPFWVKFQVPRSAIGSSLVLELDSRHLIHASCFDGVTQESVGAASRESVQGGMRWMRRGYSVNVASNQATILCKLQFVGPARFSASWWVPKSAQVASERFQRSAGLLDGATLTFALAAAVIAVFSKTRVAWIYAAWLIAGSRLAAASAGMDFNWLGWSLPYYFLPWLRKLAVLSYMLLSLSLVQSMFRVELRRLKLHRILVGITSVLFCIASISFILPYRDFLPIAWFCGAITTGTILFVLLRVVYKMPSMAAWIYCVGWTFSCVAQFGEILAASLSLFSSVGLANSITASIASNFLMAAALAERVRSERLVRKNQTEKNLQALKLVQRTYESVQLGLFTVTLNGCIVRSNPTFKSMLNIKPLNSLVWAQVFPEHDLSDVLASALRENTILNWNSCVFRIRAVRVDDAFECSIADVTTEAMSTAKLKYLADHDELTGVFNRRGLNVWVEQCQKENRWNEKLVMCYVDLHRFKLINELFGYSAGDAVLKEVASRLSSNVYGAGVHIARLGGDEFLIIFEDWSRSSISHVCGEFIHSVVNEGFLFQDKRVNIGVSVGVLNIEAGLTFVDALSAADNACSSAKALKEHIFWAETNRKFVAEYTAEKRLARLFEEHLPIDRFLLEFQPIVSLSAPSTDLSAEVLIRMRSEDGKIFSPAVFLPIAERHGLMSQVDWWVLNEASNWLVRNPQSLRSFNYLAVNLSGASLNDEALLDKITCFMQDNPQVARKILIEITESIALSDIRNTNRFVERMKLLGVRIGLDDFGAGYTSFSYLQAFPADVLKLDGAFVRNANVNPQNHRIIRSIADLSHQLGMSCVAEWAEDAKLVKTLHELGADFAQGWGLCKSIDPEKFVGISSAMELISNGDVKDYLRLIEASSVADKSSKKEPRIVTSDIKFR